MEKRKLAFIGLGIMGFPMARHLKKAGFEVGVWNRNSIKSETFVKDHGGFTSANIAEVIKDVDIVMMCLGNDSSVEEITFGKEGIVNQMKKGATLVDHTTASAKLAKSLYARCKDLGINFIDAPMTGGQAGAENAKLMMMCGGDEEVFNQVKDILQIYCLKLEYFGPAGSGQLCKMVNQICIAGIIASLSEAINFGVKAGLDTGKLLKLISGGAGSSWQMQHRHEWMLKKEYKENEGFPVEWFVKDLNMCLEEATVIGAPLEVTELITQMFRKAQTIVNPRFDTSSLIMLLK